MDLRRYKDILALKTDDNKIIGFHTYNLTVAELSEDLWAALADAGALERAQEVREELETWNSEIDQQTTDATRFEKIRSLSLNVAQICNLGCTYCAAGGDGTYGSPITKIDITKAEAQIKHFLQLAKPGENFQIEFLGGEPLLYPQIIESLCRYAELMVAGLDIKIDFVITTNGTLITDEVADIFARHNFAVTISLDGPAAINDRVRPAKNKKSSTQMTLDGLKNLISVRDDLAALNVNCVFGQHNTAVVDTYSFLTLLGVEWDLINLNFANSIQKQASELAHASEAEATRAYLDEMTELAEFIFERDGLEGLAKIAQFRRPLMRLSSQSRVNSYCAAGKSLVLADTRGDLYACNWFMNDKDERLGHLTTIDAEKWQAYSPELITLNKCETCWARHLCGGGCMAVHKGYSGQKHDKNPNFCTRTRELSALAVKYFTQSLAPAGDQL